MPSAFKATKRAARESEYSLCSNPTWILDDKAVEQLLGELGFRADTIELASEESRNIARSREVQAFLDSCTSWQKGLQPPSGGRFPDTWEILIALSAFPQAMRRHRLRGVPFAVTKATLLDLQRRVDEYSAREGRPGFDRLSWMRHHIGGKFFEIGRLQYSLGTFGFLFRVYRDAATSSVVSLALPGQGCTAEGLPGEAATGFVTRWENRREGLYAHMVSPEDGTIAASISRVEAGSSLLLDEKSTVGHIHIPAGERLELEACRDSLQAAKEFFERCFSEFDVRGFCTASWLLDPELRKILPADSNIISFGRLFRPLPLRSADDLQLRERVFGNGIGWENCQAVTSLQKAVLKHHRRGGQFRTAAGFILSEEIS